MWVECKDSTTTGLGPCLDELRSAHQRRQKALHVPYIRATPPSIARSGATWECCVWVSGLQGHPRMHGYESYNVDPFT